MTFDVVAMAFLCLVYIYVCVFSSVSGCCKRKACFWCSFYVNVTERNEHVKS